MKFCNRCVWYVNPTHWQSGPRCRGPHIPEDIVYGTRRMPLPAARYSNGAGLETGVEPCGEEGRHWAETLPKTDDERFLRASIVGWLLAVVALPVAAALIALCMVVK